MWHKWQKMMSTKRIFSFAVLVCMQSAAAFVADTGSELPGLHYVAGEKIKQVILDSDEPWLLTVLEKDDVCGKPCAEFRETMSITSIKSGGMVNLAYVNARDAVLNDDGDMEEVAKIYNITTVPLMFVFGAGPKRLKTGLRMQTESAGSFLAGGPKSLFHAAKMFTPGIVTSVKLNNVADFLHKPSPYLPRVILFTDKREVSATIKKLSIDFGSRAIFGQTVVNDASGKLAAAFGVAKEDGTMLLISPPGPIADEKLTDEALKQLEPNHFSGWAKYTGNMTYETLRKHLYTSLPQGGTVGFPQIRTQADFNKYCAAAADVSMCFIAILPSEAEGAARDRLKTKPAVEDAFTTSHGFGAVDDDEDEDDDDDGEARKLRHRKMSYDIAARVASRVYLRNDWATMGQDLKAERLPIAFMWVDADKQPDFIQKLNVGSPGFVALNPRRKKAASLRRSFQPANLYEFVVSVIDTAFPITSAPLDPNSSRQPIAFDTIATLPQVKDQPPPAAAKKAPKKSKPSTSTKQAKTEHTEL